MELVRPHEKQAEVVAHILDDVIRIPGTNLRFGIDPILGLIPVIGDILTVFCGAFIVLTARRLGVSSAELARMSTNVPPAFQSGQPPCPGRPTMYA